MVVEWNSDLYYILVLGLSNAAYLFNTYVEWRQYRVYTMVKKAPKEVSSMCTAEEFEKSRVYGLDKARFGLVNNFFGQVQTNAFLILSALPWLWKWSGQWLKVNTGSVTEIRQSMLFVTANILASTLIDLPFSYYSTFFIEQKHGFNKQTLGLWLKDKVKSLVLSIVIGCPILGALIWTVRWGGDNFYLSVWLLLAGVQALMILIFPTFIQPLFNKFVPEDSADLLRVHLVDERIKKDDALVFEEAEEIGVRVGGAGAPVHDVDLGQGEAKSRGQRLDGRLQPTIRERVELVEEGLDEGGEDEDHEGLHAG